MQKLITYEKLRSFAYSNDKMCQKPIKGLVLDFFGLGGQEMFDEDTPFGKELAELGIILLIPYNNPWAWMNEQAVLYTDELVAAVMKEHALPDTVPVVSSGGSMGGLSALVYAKYAKRTPVACVANCPVCDLLYHYNERPDLPRTLYSAFYFSETDCLEDALKTSSPLHLADGLPRIDYYVFQCEEDSLVKKEAHSDKFVEKMRQARRIVYHTIPGRGHCDLGEDMERLYRKYIVEAVLAGGKASR